MTTNSPNPVDGDVQALIADCEREIATLTDHIERMKKHYAPFGLSKYESQLKRQQVALAALTAAPVAYVMGDEAIDDFNRGYEFFAVRGAKDEPEMSSLALYATPPAQLLRPVELPSIKTERSDWSVWNWIEHLGGRFQKGQPGDYIEFGSVYAVAQMLKQYRRTVTAEVIAEIADSLRQQGYEVKND